MAKSEKLRPGSQRRRGALAARGCRCRIRGEETRGDRCERPPREEFSSVFLLARETRDKSTSALRFNRVSRLLPPQLSREDFTADLGIIPSKLSDHPAQITSISDFGISNPREVIRSVFASYPFTCSTSPISIYQLVY